MMEWILKIWWEGEGAGSKNPNFNVYLFKIIQILITYYSVEINNVFFCRIMPPALHELLGRSIELIDSLALQDLDPVSLCSILERFIVEWMKKCFQISSVGLIKLKQEDNMWIWWRKFVNPLILWHLVCKHCTVHYST